MKAVEGTLGAYIAPVSHNRVSTHLVASITSTILGNYSQDPNKDKLQLQEMGTDTGVIFGYNAKRVSTTCYIFYTKIYTHCILCFLNFTLSYPFIIFR
jgi:hypothetical protein